MRPPALSIWLGLIVTFAAVAGAAVQSTAPRAAEDGELLDDPHAGRFTLLRSGHPITLQASTLYAAALVPGTIGNKGPLTPPDGLELDPRGNRPDLMERGVTLFRVPKIVAPRGLDTPPPPDAWQVSLASGLPAQPVFERGAALRIPTDEVIVAFPPGTGLNDAKRLLAESWDDLDARGLRELRPGRFVCALRDASAGRAFEASRMLAQVDGVLWAEPSFINIYLETPGEPPDGRVQFRQLSSHTHQQLLEAKFVTIKLIGEYREPESDAWQVAFDGHFEDNIDKWIVARDEGSNRILPVVVRNRAHDGNRSVYMSGKGLAGNTPTDPYLEAASSYLIGPIVNLAAYSEVFVELWFWAQFEDPVDAPRQVYDFGRVLLFDVASKKYVYERPIAPVGRTGDLSQDRRTDRGWRKLMFRVPLELLANPLQVHVHFYSDEFHGAAGLYVDDIRVLYRIGAGDDDNFCRDPAALQQYAIMPRGQIAGRPESEDPRADAAAAWIGGIPTLEMIVALLDDGVERGHPDLAYWEPDKDGEAAPGDDGRANGGSPGEGAPYAGLPVTPEDRHGTACAGVIGAIANNGVGIAGVAPGALLLPLHRGIDDLSIVRAIDTAAGHGAHVLVIPWGWTGAAPLAVTEAIVEAIEAGTTVVAAAGDGVHRPYSEWLDYPCNLSAQTPLICVGASGIAGEPKGPSSEDGLYWWSSAEDESGPDLLAPGAWLRSTDRRGPLGYNDGSQGLPADWTAEFSGTGASACYVGGVAALMLTHDPPLEPAELKRLITASATRLPSDTPRRGDAPLVAPQAAAQAAIDSAAARERAQELTEEAPGR